MPPRAEPMVKPQNIMVTKLERRDVGAYSEVKVIALGKAPPKPKPVRNFQIIRVCKSAEKRQNTGNSKHNDRPNQNRFTA